MAANRKIGRKSLRTASLRHLLRVVTRCQTKTYGGGWVHAHNLQPGDRFLGHDNQVVTVEEVTDTGEWKTVYNFRVADFHTYFVGGWDWGFSIWVHNAYRIQEGVRRSVAAREAGVSRVYAEVFDADGRLLRRQVISLDDLFSPEDAIPKDARYMRIYSGMQTPQGRAQIPLIAVIETDNVTGLTPILQVQLTP